MKASSTETFHPHTVLPDAKCLKLQRALETMQTSGCKGDLSVGQGVWSCLSIGKPTDADSLTFRNSRPPGEQGHRLQGRATHQQQTMRDELDNAFQNMPDVAHSGYSGS